jgi:NAD-dependent deacetylase
MHGSLEKSRCMNCGEVYLDDTAWINDEGNSPSSSGLLSNSDKATPQALDQYEVKLREGMPLSPCCGELLRPHIVWFGELPLHMNRICKELEACDLFVSIGTSGVVYPAANFIEVAKGHGAVTVCLNLEPIPQSSMIDHFIQGTASAVVTEFFRLKD